MPTFNDEEYENTNTDRLLLPGSGLSSAGRIGRQSGWRTKFGEPDASGQGTGQEICPILTSCQARWRI